MQVTADRSPADEIEEEDILSYSEVPVHTETKEKSSWGLKKYL